MIKRLCIGFPELRSMVLLTFCRSLTPIFSKTRANFEKRKTLLNKGSLGLPSSMVKTHAPFSKWFFVDLCNSSLFYESRNLLFSLLFCSLHIKQDVEHLKKVSWWEKGDISVLSWLITVYYYLWSTKGPSFSIYKEATFMGRDKVKG